MQSSFRTNSRMTRELAGHEMVYDRKLYGQARVMAAMTPFIWVCSSEKTIQLGSPRLFVRKDKMCTTLKKLKTVAEEPILCGLDS